MTRRVHSVQEESFRMRPNLQPSPTEHGRSDWEILSSGLERIVEVPEEKIAEGLRVFFSLANLKVEPTAALGLGALLTEREIFQGKTICCAVSGGNVDPEVYGRLLLGKNV